MTVRLRSLTWFATWIVLSLMTTLVVLTAWRADAAPGDTDTTFVPITPCRLFDFRPGGDNIGPRSSPLGPGEVHTVQVTGTNGNCVGIPADATAVAMNVTIVNPTAQSNLRLWPADVAVPPLVSNINWTAGQSPEANKVDVKLSPDGKAKLRNHAGTVDVIGDIVGYYTNSTLKEIAARLTNLEGQATTFDNRLVSLEGRATTRFAKVDADPGSATLLRGHGVTAVGSIATGVFSVTFDGPVTDCGWIATRNDNLEGVALPGEIAIELGSAADPATLWVRTFNSAGTAADPTSSDGFTVQVICPPT